MIDSDFEEFAHLIADVYALKGKDASEFVIGVWWEAMRRFDLAAVRQGINRHFANPDAGQFLPMPADIVRMLQGRTVDSAAVAWAKVEKAIRLVGPYESVVFDDPRIHACIDHLGGWIALCSVTGDEMPFKANAFKTEYAGLRMRSEIPPCEPVMIGIIQASNSQKDYEVRPPMLVGDRAVAQRVLTGPQRADVAALAVRAPAGVA